MDTDCAGFMQIVILYTAVYSLGYDGSLLNGLQALPAWAKDFASCLLVVPCGTLTCAGPSRWHQVGSDCRDVLPVGDSAPAAALPVLIGRPKIPTTFIVAEIVDRYGRKIPLVCFPLP